ncbi:TonB family protein [Rheinheimera sp.]|uniref:TonB family protein n=1 Tax=Rheinheimera sp. TaxID=1869214 RepID=UPI0027B8F281|nr:TonB family protein [Rheinheimera sp.]
MRKLVLMAILCSTFASQADLLDAMKAYENKDFQTATQQFTALLPLANGQAAFNLGAMAANAEGQPRDLVKALAYFEFAATREHPSAKALADKISTKLTAAEQQQAATLLTQLLQQVKVTGKLKPELSALFGDKRKAIKRIPPEYPKEAAARGAFGSVTMRLLVNEQGDVEAVDVLNAFPKGLFEREAIRALKRWKYEAGNNKFISRVMLTFSLGDIDHQKVERIFSEYQMWQYAALGSPMHQNALANILDLARSKSAMTQFVDKSLPPALGPITADFVKNGKVVSKELQLPEGFKDHTFVTLDAQAVVQAVHDNNAERQAKQAAVLLGKRLTTEQVTAGFYKLQNQDGNKSPRLLSAQRIPQTYSNDYWLEQAARGGNLEAQRALAALRLEWELYLLEQQDPVVQSWAGTALILNGQKVAGEKLLDAAIAKGHATAKELKAAL